MQVCPGNLSRPGPPSMFTAGRLLLLLVSGGSCSELPPSPLGPPTVAKKEPSAAARLLNVFNIVSFPNDPCQGDGWGKHGTCKTASECATLGGTTVGTCASGFGVCCSTYQGCGGTYNLNNSYWRDSRTHLGDAGGTDVSPCTFTICKASSDICQIRLDFDAFSLQTPNTVDTGAGKGLGTGESRTQCQDAQFRASSSTGAAPIICGSNTGQHMYLEVLDTCNSLTMSWLPGKAIPTWSIRMTQHSCTDWWRAPPDCLQYVTGSSGIVQSFNYDGGVHLANQRYQICFRIERGMCTMSYYASPTSFRISGPSTTATANVGSGSCTEDYITIPGGTNPALPTGPTAPLQYINRFCGGILSYIDASTSTYATISTTFVPFRVGVYTDGGEQDTFTAPATYAPQYSVGFQLYYSQTAC